MVQSAINVAADFYVLCLPIAEVCKLHLKFRQKIGVIAIFMAGLLYVIPIDLSWNTSGTNYSR